MGSTPKVKKPIPKTEVTEISEEARRETLLRQRQNQTGASSTMLSPNQSSPTGYNTTLG